MELEFNRCPKYDADLKAWSNLYPEMKDVFFGEKRDYNKFVYTLANLKNVDTADKTVIEYGFTEDEIQEITDAYKESTWEKVNGNVITDVKNYRDLSKKEDTYINNIIRDWKDYEVPSVEKGYYYINSGGVYRKVEHINEETGEKIYENKDVCRTPFVICGISVPVVDEEIYYKIRYKTITGEIKEYWANQSTLLSRKELKTSFLNHNLNCPENSILMETIDYISRSIADFGQSLKKEFSSKRNGWNKDKTVFVLGNRGITSTGVEPVLSVCDNKGFPELEKNGTIEGWVDGVKDLLEHDVIRFKCYDALTAVLKAPLGIESHATDHYGNTSQGKTFSAQLALSMIGDAEALTIGAKSTAKGILVHVRDFSDLPILIDESSDAGEHLADLVYPLTSNKGRVKSTQDGQRDGGEEYHTTTMFTGEKPIRDCLQNSGQQYRVNELDDTLPDLPTKEINRVKQAIRDNHGHIIEKFIQRTFYSLNSGSLEITYNTFFDMLPDNTSNIEGRSRSIFSCIATAGSILESIFKEIGIPRKNPIDIVNKYYNKCIIEKPVELEYIRALRCVLGWIHSDYGRFARVEVNEEKKSMEGGGLNQYINNSEKVEYIVQNDRNKRYGYIDDEFIDIIGTEFTKKMKDEGYSPSKLKEDWFKQGIVNSDSPNQRIGTYHFKRENKLIAGVRIYRQVAEELTGITSLKQKDDGENKDENIRTIIETIRFLTQLKGSADVNLIRLITEVKELDEHLATLSRIGRIYKISQTGYRYV